jgi:putative transcriptional regulator
MTTTTKTLDFILARGLCPEALSPFGLHSVQRHGSEFLAIPYILNGAVVNHKYRGMDEKVFEQDANATKCFWNQDALTNPEHSELPVIITEGEFDAMAAIHETMEGLHDIGAIDKQTMREFDEACLTPVHVLAPDEIKEIRLREHISQPVFARYLNVSKNLVSDWERGVKKPGGPALRLLSQLFLQQTVLHQASKQECLRQAHCVQLHPSSSRTR